MGIANGNKKILRNNWDSKPAHCFLWMAGNATYIHDLLFSLLSRGILVSNTVASKINHNKFHNISAGWV